MKPLSFVMAFAMTTIAGSAYASPAVPFLLPQVGHADTEVVTNAAFAAWEPKLREFRFNMEFAGTASNNVELAFGTDVDGDGQLSDGEIDFRAGWDCGLLFFANNATDERVTEAAADGAHAFSCFYGMDLSGRIANAVITDNGSNVFRGIAAAKPAWLYSSRWNMVRLVGRGENVRAGERFSVKTTPECFFFRLR